MKFNINRPVKVKITTEGQKIMEMEYNKHQQFLYNSKFTPLPTDENGYTTMVLWEVMSIFGPHMYHGGPLIIETDIIIFDGELINT